CCTCSTVFGETAPTTAPGTPPSKKPDSAPLSTRCQRCGDVEGGACGEGGCTAEPPRLAMESACGGAIAPFWEVPTMGCCGALWGAPVSVIGVSPESRSRMGITEPRV